MKAPSIAPRPAEPLPPSGSAAPTHAESPSSAPFASVLAGVLQPDRAATRAAERRENDRRDGERRDDAARTRESSRREADRASDARSASDAAAAARTANADRRARERDMRERDMRQRDADERSAARADAVRDARRNDDANETRSASSRSRRDADDRRDDASDDASDVTRATDASGTDSRSTLDVSATTVAGATDVAATAQAAADLAASAAAASSIAASAPAAPATAATSAAAVERGTDALLPEFRDRLERVIDRMREELGHTVRIVETYRSQARQDALFAQGRTQPGDVVTWTRDSNHTAGLAADVTIDGGYDDTAAFASLARIAREEGLRTLGPRDPGHIELARGAASLAARGASAEPRTMPTQVAGTGALAQVATVAPVAVVAPVAAVAQVAQVATVAPVAQATLAAQSTSAARAARSEGERATPRASTDPRAAAASTATGTDDARDPLSPTPMAPSLAGAATRQDPGAKGEDGGRDERSSPHERAAAERAAADGSANGTMSESDAARVMTNARASEPSAAPRIAVQGPAGSIAHADASERIARMLRIREDGAEKTLSQVLLRIDHPDGSQDRIRVDRRGLGIGATLDMSDLSTADELRTHVGELQRALERAGVESGSVAVRGARAGERPDALGLLAGASLLASERDAIRAGASNGSHASNNGGAPRERQDRQNNPSRDSRAPSDPNRQRSRREQRGTR